MTKSKRAKFIVIEGIDGAGTTSQAKRLFNTLNREGCPSVYTFEPTDGPIGSMIRQALRRRLVNPIDDSHFEIMDSNSLTLLFSADRMDHNQSIILPSLKTGRTVICDRYYYSTVAYQGVDGDKNWIMEVNKNAKEPDLVIYLKIDPEISLARIGNRTDREIFEKVDFLSKVSDNYDELFKDNDKSITLDGKAHFNVIAEKIHKIVTELIATDVDTNKC